MFGLLCGGGGAHFSAQPCAAGASLHLPGPEAGYFQTHGEKGLGFGVSSLFSKRVLGWNGEHMQISSDISG